MSQLLKLMYVFGDKYNYVAECCFQLLILFLIMLNGIMTSDAVFVIIYVRDFVKCFTEKTDELLLKVDHFK